MEFLVLGPVEVRRDGRVRALSGRLQRVLFGVLLARANQPVPVDVLIDVLWGERRDPRAGQKLQLHVHRLRGVLGEARLSFGSAGYLLRVLPGELDAERFESLVDEAVEVVEQEPQRVVEVLRKALGLWRGVPFGDVDVPVLEDWAQRLARHRLLAIETLYQAELACGLNAAVIAELTDLVREHPLRERLHVLLMTALHRAGRRSEALEAYGRARDVLVGELGVEPGSEMRDLQRRILDGEPLESETNASGESRASVPAQLPVDVRGFVGREAELAELDDLLSTDAPVVISAVAGTAGVGKTALAVRWAHRVRDRFPDGQLYVDLRGYGPDQPVLPDDALAGFLRALGLDGAAIPQELAERAARFRSLVDRRRMLIVLDNARTPEQVRPLLPGGSSCVVLVTSRDSLAGLVAREGAHRLDLDRLPLADARGLLHALLGDRVDAETAAIDALVERCVRLPLALRITAELIRSQPARSIADLAEELADQQDALELLDLDGDPHTAVRAVFSWSYRQLDHAVARIFRLLGLHPGHDLDAYAVAALAGAELRGARQALDVLLRAHLVDRTPGGRYQPHDLLRAYAAELSMATDTGGERRAALRRLLDHYLYTASAAMDLIAPHDLPRPKVPEPECEAPTFSGDDHAFRWLDAERANLLEVAQHGGPEFVIHMSETVWRYFDIGGYLDDAVALHTRSLEVARTLGDQLAEANARRQLAVALNRIGDNREVIDHLERALTVYEEAEDPARHAATLSFLGVVYSKKGELAEAERRFEQASAPAGRSGIWKLRAAVMLNRSRNLESLGRFEDALRLQDDVLAQCQGKDDKQIETNALQALARGYLRTGRHEEAFDYARRGLQLARETGYRSLEADCSRVLGVVSSKRGNHEHALRYHEGALATARAVGDTELLAEVLNALGATHAATGCPDEALRCHDEALAVATEADHREVQAHTRAGIAEVHAGLGDHVRANEHWRQALSYYEDLGLPDGETRLRQRLDHLSE
jgi:DNA-binding SARP family transcriptional activator/Tfp pilus assembly protein PilF